MSGADRRSAAKRARRVVVAGATGTLGRAVCSALIDRGDCVVAIGRTDRALSAMQRDLPARARNRLLPVVADLTLPGVLERAARLVLQAGPVDDLVISIGPFEPSPLRELSADRLAAMLAVHAVAPVLLLHALRDALAASQGAVVALSDQGLRRPYPNHAAYLAAKGALEGAMLALAVDLAPRVRVNILRPGIVSDPASNDTRRAGRLAARSLLGRFGNAAEVAAVVIAMIDAAWLSGQIWTVG